MGGKQLMGEVTGRKQKQFFNKNWRLQIFANMLNKYCDIQLGQCLKGCVSISVVGLSGVGSATNMTTASS